MLLALLSIAVAWAICALVILGAFAATSFDDFVDLAKAALRSAVPAVWFVPAALFLQGHSAYEVLFGLALMANAIRLLLAARPPHKLRLKSAAPIEPRYQLDPFFGETLPVIGGALLAQTGVAVSVAAKHAIWGAALVACGTCVIVWWWRSTRVQSLQSGSRWKAPATVALSVVLTVLQFEAKSTPSIAAETRASVSSAIPLTTQGVKPQDIRPLPGKDAVPGVILRPRNKPAKIELPAIRAATPHGILRSVPATLQFSGEYHLFPASSGGVQRDSTVLEGTPLDAAYASLAGGEIETEAYQPFRPPIDLTGCGNIRLRFRYKERSPASATVYLLTTAGPVELGAEIFGMDGSDQVTLDFAIPAPQATLAVNAIRIVFHLDPFHRTQSARIAVDGFEFHPRGSTN